MPRIITVFLIVFLAINFPVIGNPTHSLQISINDSIKIKNTVEGLYSWYADLVKRNKVNKEFNPEFVKDKNGMTGLDFTRYKAGLIKHDFTEDFIKRKVNEYKPCQDNLSTIPYSNVVKFEDLDQFEEIKCGFRNRFEFAQSKEPHDGAELVMLNQIDKKTIQSKVRFYNKTAGGAKQYSGSALVMLVKSKTGWMINDLK